MPFRERFAIMLLFSLMQAAHSGMYTTNARAGKSNAPSQPNLLKVN